MKSRFVLLALSLIIALASYTSVSAEEKAAADSQKQSAAAAEEAIPEVPENGTLEDYQDCINALKAGLQKKAQSMIAQAQNDGVNPRSEAFANSLKEVAKEYFGRVELALDKAMLLKDVSDDDFEDLASSKFQIIKTLGQISEEDESVVKAKLEAFVKQLREMGKNDIAAQIDAALFQEKIRDYVRSGDVEAFTKAAAEIDEQVEKAGKDISILLARQAAMILMAGAALPEYKAPEGRQENYLKAIAEASDPEVQKIAGQLEKEIIRAEGEKRFEDALGNEFKFGGTFTDGSEYNAKDYAGKVVLIDFWATWCGPCCAELPNVKKMYAAYHDKGFEVIGVSCDNPDEEEKFNQFLKDKEIPWKQMFDGKAVVPGLKTKSGEPILVSDYYGINGIPCPVLIGKDGKVISLNARGAELKKQLVKIYGEVEGIGPVDEEEEGEEVDIFADEESEDEDADDTDEDDQAADEAIPDVPVEGTLANYKEYIQKVNDLLNKKLRNVMRQAKKDGVNPQSEEFENSLKNTAKEYFTRIEDATDKALLLKDVSDEDFDELVGAKIQLIQVTTQLNNEEADAANAKLEAFAAQLRKLDKPKFADKIDNVLFGNKVMSFVKAGNVEEFAKAAAEIDEKVKKAGKDITQDLAGIAVLIVLGGNELKDYKAPEDRQGNYLKALSESTDPEVNKLANVLKMFISQTNDEE